MTSSINCLLRCIYSHFQLSSDRLFASYIFECYKLNTGCYPPDSLLLKLLSKLSWFLDHLALKFHIEVHLARKVWSFLCLLSPSLSVFFYFWRLSLWRLEIILACLLNALLFHRWGAGGGRKIRPGFRYWYILSYFVELLGCSPPHCHISVFIDEWVSRQWDDPLLDPINWFVFKIVLHQVILT